MANTKSAAKRARQTEKRTLQNKRTLTNVKNVLKKVRVEIGAKNKEAARATLQQVSSVLDCAVKKGRIHRNAANRHKSTLSKQLAAIA